MEEQDELLEGDEGVHSASGLRVCSRCGENAVVDDPLFNSVVCTNCGNVEEDVALRHNVEAEATQTVRADKPVKVLFSSIPAGASHALRLSGQSEDRLGSMKALTRMVASLKLPQHLVEQSKAYLREIVKDEALKRCRCELLAASCIYYVCRREQRPLTLEQIAQSQGLKMREIAGLFRRVSAKLKSSAPLPPPKAKVFVQNICDKLKLASPIPATARQILKFAKQAALDAGRMPLPLAVAAVFIAMDVHGQKTKGSEAEKYCEICDVKYSTVKDRMGEMRAAFISSASALPWGKTFTRENFSAFVPYVLQHMSKKTPTKSSSNNNNNNNTSDKLPPLIPAAIAPPSFRVSQQARERRRLKLLHAKARLRRTLLNYPDLASKLTSTVLVKLEQRSEEEAKLPPPDAPLDEEDIMIERLLIVGVADSLLLDGYYQSAKQLSFPRERNASLDSEQLSEADIPDAELSKFIRRPDEVKALEERPAKKQRAEEEEEEKGNGVAKQPVPAAAEVVTIVGDDN